MTWAEIRTAFPDRWLVIEALAAHTEADDRRALDRIAVIETCADGSAAFARYRELHRQSPERELYFVRTTNEELKIFERRWVGIRPENAAHT